MSTKIAGKYLAGLDPSIEMVRGKIRSGKNELRSISPEAELASKFPSTAFDSAGLGFSSYG